MTNRLVPLHQRSRKNVTLQDTDNEFWTFGGLLSSHFLLAVRRSSLSFTSDVPIQLRHTTAPSVKALERNSLITQYLVCVACWGLASNLVDALPAVGRSHIVPPKRLIFEARPVVDGWYGWPSEEYGTWKQRKPAENLPKGSLSIQMSQLCFSRLYLGPRWRVWVKRGGSGLPVSFQYSPRVDFSVDGENGKHVERNTAMANKI